MQYAYLIAALIILTVWIFLFSYRNDLRKEMLVMSTLAAPLGLFDFWFVPKYWRPITLFHLPVGIEGIIYSFCIGGITSVLYAEIAHKTPRHIHNWHKKSSVLVLLITFIVFLTLESNHVPNPMIALYVGLFAGIAASLYWRKDLIKGTFIGALAFGVLYFCLIKFWMTIFPGVRSWFLLQGLPKTYIVGVPLWEVLFGIIFAAYWGNIYELIFGYRFVSQSHTRKAQRKSR